jgi:hypothetical protein
MEQCVNDDQQRQRVGEQGEEPSYEDLCRAHIEALMAAAAAAEVQTGLAARVATWRDKLAPVLAEQDARGDFDIHECAHSSCLCIYYLQLFTAITQQGLQIATTPLNHIVSSMS